MAAKKKPQKPDSGKTARRVARNVVGIVKAARPIESDPRRKKPKHKKDPRTGAEA
ncbi:MAG: hypothetical protein HYX27_25340 [Acidobacteria bacterium]|nr:hypothetical protein [Acidobacteriota bacterium]